MNSLSEADLLRLVARVEAIEARQRAVRIHDPDCRAGSAAVEVPGYKWTSLPCTCWLSEGGPTGSAGQGG